MIFRRLALILRRKHRHIVHYGTTNMAGDPHDPPCYQLGR